jgi:hypothetical protein
LKQVVENSSHGIKTAKTGDFGRFSALFASPAVSPGAIDFVFVPLYGSGGSCHNRDGSLSRFLGGGHAPQKSSQP